MTISATKCLAMGIALASASSAFAIQATDAYRPAGVSGESSANALARHVRSLAASPRSLPALLGAANAALDLGDTQAALTFFARAEEVAPRDGRVKAGMASAFVQTEQPQAALKFFSEALSMGAPLYLVAKDRGLAYDIMGDQALAQADYAVALARGGDPETERRMALSRAISGDKDGALALLEPQVRRHDRAGWRARAFVLALTGDPAEAAKSAATFMPPHQVSAMQPFLALLPRLNPAEQALAVHFGRFPQNAALRPDTRLAAVSPTVTAGKPDQAQPALGKRAKRSSTSSSRPKGRPEFPSTRDRSADAEPRTSARTGRKSRTQTAAVQSVPLAAATQVTAVPPPPQGVSGPTLRPQAPANIVQASRQPEPDPAPAQANPVSLPAATQTQLAESGSSPGSAVMLAELAPSTMPSRNSALPGAHPDLPASAPALSLSSDSAKPASRSPMEDEIDFADIAAEISAMEINEAPAPAPAEPKVKAKPKAAPAKAEAPKAKKPEPAKAAQPSRIWVQVAAAQDKAAFPAEYRKIKAKAGKLLADKAAWTTPMRLTNRLLVGPFKTDKEAQDLVTQLSKLKISSYAWTSDAGQIIEKLPAK